MSITSQLIPERNDVTADDFKNEIYPAAKPVVLRDFVADWESVKAAKESPSSLLAYVESFITAQNP